MSEAPASPSAPAVPAAGDFLQRIVDRAFDRAVALDPRLPSVFEPPAAATGLSPFAGAIDDTARTGTPPDDAAPVAEHAHPARRAAPQDETRRAEAADAPDPAGQASPRALAMRPVEPSLRETTPREHASASFLPHPLVEPASGPSASPTPVVTAYPVAPTSLPVARRARDPDAPGALQVRATHASIAALAAPDPVRPPQSEADGRPRTNAIEPSLRPLVAPESAAALPTRRRADNTRTSALPAAHEPIVNVTIGRIEVRAVGAVAAPPRQRAAAPRAPGPLSLDDYLRRRGGTR